MTWRRDIVFGLVVLTLGTAVGALAATGDVRIVVGTALVGAFVVLIVQSAEARILAAAGGALLVFQAEGDTGKVAYLAVLLLCLAVAVVNLVRDKRRVSAGVFAPMLGASVVFMAAVAVSFLVSRGKGIPANDWGRDALAYLLLVILPVIGIEAGRKVSQRFLYGTIGLLGIVASVGLALDWLSRRGASLSAERIVLSTTTFAILGVIVAAVRVGQGKNWVRWSVALSIMLGALILTGSRTNLLVIAAAFIGIAGSKAKARVRPGRVVAMIVLAGAAAIVFILVFGDSLLTEQGFLTGRLSTLQDALSGGLSQDQSYLARQGSYRVSQLRWETAPWLGAGPGYVYPGTGLYTLDTPWAVPAKFGILGTAAIAWLLFTFSRCVVAVRKSVEWRPEFTIGRGWALCVLVITPFGPWVEDKGTGVAMMFLAALAMTTLRSGETEGSSDESGGARVGAGQGLPPSGQDRGVARRAGDRHRDIARVRG